MACKVGAVSAHWPVRVMDPGALPLPMSAHQSPLGCRNRAWNGTERTRCRYLTRSGVPIRLAFPLPASPDPRPPLIPTARTSPRHQERIPISREDQTLWLIGRFVIYSTSPETWRRRCRPAETRNSSSSRPSAGTGFRCPAPRSRYSSTSISPRYRSVDPSVGSDFSLRPSSSMVVWFLGWWARLVLILVVVRIVQRYMQQHGDVELSALGLGASPCSHPLTCIFLISICKPDLTQFCLRS